MYEQKLTDQSKKWVFVEEYDGMQEFVLDPHESQEHGWFTFAEYKNLKYIPHDLEAVEKVFEYIKTTLG